MCVGFFIAGDVCFQCSLITGDSVVSRKPGMCPGAVLREAAVNMLTTILLSALLMLGGLVGVAVSDLQVYGKSIHSDKTLLSSDDGQHTVRKQPNQQVRIIVQNLSKFLKLGTTVIYVNNCD